MGRSSKLKVTKGVTATRTSLQSRQVVEGTPFTEEELRVYARQYLLASGTEKGDTVAFDHWDPTEKPYLEAMRTEAEELGINFQVIVPENDPKFRDQVEDLVDSGAIVIGPEYPPYAYQIDEESSGNSFEIEKYESAYNAGEIRWMNSVIPTQAWADQVYSEIDDPAKRLRALGEDFQRFLRIHPESTETWAEHMEKLQIRSEEISKMEPEEFQFNSTPDSLYPGDPGTDLTLRPIEGARFIPVEIENRRGEKTIVNSPTEEVFFTPAPGSANGRASMSRPYFSRDEDTGESTRVDGVVLIYQEGIVRDAYSVLEPEKNDLLRRDFIENGSENGQRILGEIGLVDPESPVAKSGKTYDTAIIDENSGSHGGHGSAWAFSIQKEALERGVLPDEMRDASVHVDLTFGSPKLDISLTKKDGSNSDLVKDGKWVGP
jgi:leucyl aminopeptidase (aminopeptidase T)